MSRGGNNPTIVCEGVDVPKVAREIVEDIMRNCGQVRRSISCINGENQQLTSIDQVCVSSSRVYVPIALHEEFRKEIRAAAQGYTSTGRLGPLQNAGQFARLQQLFETCTAEGSTFLTGGMMRDGPGFFMEPTIVDNPAHDSTVANEEAFGTKTFRSLR